MSLIPKSRVEPSYETITIEEFERLAVSSTYLMTMEIEGIGLDVVLSYTSLCHRIRTAINTSPGQLYAVVIRSVDGYGSAMRLRYIGTAEGCDNFCKFGV